jgi:hypothetical protein
MSTVPPSAKYYFSSGRHTTALIVRAGVARTFGSLGGFLATIFLGGGIYLLQEEFSDPLRAQAVGLISGAFIIALATILIYFIFSPRSKIKRSRIRRRPQKEVYASAYFIDIANVTSTPSDTARRL